MPFAAGPLSRRFGVGYTWPRLCLYSDVNQYYIVSSLLPQSAGSCKLGRCAMIQQGIVHVAAALRIPTRNSTAIVRCLTCSSIRTFVDERVVTTRCLRAFRQERTLQTRADHLSFLRPKPQLAKLIISPSRSTELDSFTPTAPTHLAFLSPDTMKFFAFSTLLAAVNGSSVVSFDELFVCSFVVFRLPSPLIKVMLPLQYPLQPAGSKTPRKSSSRSC